MLSEYRVLDITDETGFLCAKALGDFDAEVIKIERPDGDESRNIGPYYNNIVDPEKSLYWFAFNQNKKSITLDIETEQGKEIFIRLVESFSPGTLEALGLGYSQLSQINPQIILTSISSFGQQGPYRGYKGSDLVLYALSGLMFVTGDPDRPPLAPSYHHSYLFAAMQAAVGTLIALYQRDSMGGGQHIDISAQMALTWVTQPGVIGIWDLFGDIAQRTGRVRTQPFNGLDMPILWKCKDGDVGYAFMLLSGNARANAALAAWIEADDPSVTVFSGIDWKRIRVEDISVEAGQEIVTALTSFFLNHTKEELLEGSLERGIQLYPSLTPTETLEFTQLHETNFWQHMHHPELDDTLVYPRPAVKSTVPLKERMLRPPLIGEHNMEIYGNELDLTLEEINELKRNNVI